LPLSGFTFELKPISADWKLKMPPPDAVNVNAVS
jgi:hypothetical protein